ncbi:hypothetical protein [Lentibacillus saliphilus]|uniref:hypothetical protein n=1 Tax=Lentibacillus saliphilus TaxID=2737028 RepID=UPI001C30D7D4|nr:hypothetical protein [Lentibacillus saliphilus]
MTICLKRLFFIGAFITLGGCSVFHANTDLMSPPQLSVAKEEIRQAISLYLPENVELQMPLNHQDGSPIELVDLNGDEEDEAVVFYKSQGQADIVKGIVLQNNNGWEKIADIRGEGKILVDLTFDDLTDDGHKEILAGFAYTEDSKDYGLIVYDIFSSSKPSILLNKPYSHFLVDAFEQVEKNNLVIIKFVKEHKNTVSLYDYRNEAIVEVDQLELDHYINGYYNVMSGQITEKQKGLMLDVGLGAHSAQTFIISISDDEMTNWFSFDNDPTFKASAVLSADTNGDGILEYGILEEPYMEEPLPYATTPFITVYYQLHDDGSSHVVSKAYYDYEHLYKVSIPLDWPRLQIDRSDDRKRIEIKPAGTDVVFLDVYVSEDKRPRGDGWFVLAETEEFVYLSKTTKKENRRLFQLLQPLDMAN